MGKGIQLEYTPHLEEALFIIGFDGWGNALDISKGMVEYLIRKLRAKPFGRIDPDDFYIYEKNRPVIKVHDGLLKGISPPGCHFFTTDKNIVGRDIILCKAIEPDLQWSFFIDLILSLCHDIGVKTIISLGSMYDNVLHTETIISALVSNEDILDGLKKEQVLPIDYQGPGAIHSSILSEASKQGFECISLWSHCPYYLQGTTHFGLLSHLGKVLSSWGGFNLDVEELKYTWKELSAQIQDAIDKNPEIQEVIKNLRKTKFKGAWNSVDKSGKVIRLDDVLKPKK